ncbi:MAG: N-acetylmuramoyl-L-alanine amidase family protein, partial [Acidimicrobiia bacterium]
MSDLRSPRQVVVVVFVAALLLGILVWRLGADPAPADVTAPTAGPTGEGFVGYVVTQEGSVLSTNPGGAGAAVAEGLIFPVTQTANENYEVLDNCNRPGWVSSDQVAPGFVPSERVRQMDRSVFVIDPGHGAPDLGAVGPSGLTEAEANIDVSARVVQLLGSAHDIDWGSGAVTSGNSVPAAAVAVMTRYPEGPDGGDYELGLTFRATMGNAVDA